MVDIDDSLPESRAGDVPISEGICHPIRHGPARRRGCEYQVLRQQSPA